MYPPAGPDFEAGMGVSQNKLFYFFHLYDFFWLFPLVGHLHCHWSNGDSCSAWFAEKRTVLTWLCESYTGGLIESGGQIKNRHSREHESEVLLLCFETTFFFASGPASGHLFQAAIDGGKSGHAERTHDWNMLDRCKRLSRCCHVAMQPRRNIDSKSAHIHCWQEHHQYFMHQVLRGLPPSCVYDMYWFHLSFLVWCDKFCPRFGISA